MRNADLRGSGNRPGWPRPSRTAAWVALLLIVAGNTARGQDAPMPPPGILADFVLSEVEFRGRVNVGLAEIEEKTGLKKGARSDAFRIIESLEGIRKLYRHRGFEQTEAKLIEGSKPGETRVIIEIVEGPKSVPKTFSNTPTPSSVGRSRSRTRPRQPIGTRDRLFRHRLDSAKGRFRGFPSEASTARD